MIMNLQDTACAWKVKKFKEKLQKRNTRGVRLPCEGEYAAHIHSSCLCVSTGCDNMKNYLI